MTLELTPQEQLARARADLRMGAAIVLEAGGAAALVLAAETAGWRGSRTCGRGGRSIWRSPIGGRRR